jgi:lysophospholipase
VSQTSLSLEQNSPGKVFDRRSIPREAVETRWTAPDGHPIRRIDWLIPNGACRGSLLFMAGRGDAYEKYLETLDYWHRRGWRVTAMDWRGQAGSGRFGADDVTGHIDDFAIWVADLAAFWEDWEKSTPGPHVLAGHSMGGHLVLRAIAEGKVDPVAVVLSAPMLGFLNSGVPAGLMQIVAKLMRRIGDPRRTAWKWSEKPGQLPANRASLLTHDADRYGDEVWWRERRPELAMGPGSWGWVERAYASMRGLTRSGVLEKITLPIMIVATSSDRLVDNTAIERAARRMPRAQLMVFGQEARHEILREEDVVRDRAIAAIDDFLDRTAPVRD